MTNLNRTISAVILVGSLSSATLVLSETSERGLFSDETDVGNVRKPGSVEYDSARGSYWITGGGENMWSTNDAFHFVWQRMSGDLTLAANVRWIGTNGNPHRKACLVIRQTLDADSPYADVAVHGDGLTSLQYRETKGGLTREIQANVSAPDRVRLEKRGEYVSMSVATAGGPLRPAGGSFRIEFKAPFYAGLGVCAHDNNAIERAEFSRVEIVSLPSPARAPTNVQSTLEFISIASKDRRVVYHTRDHIEAPNWSRDGNHLLFNSKGRVWRMPVAGGAPEAIDSGFATRCNNDHGISPDGTQLVISDQSKGDRRSRIYILPIG
ncbi:MAG TPA: hypothetical protein VFR76_14590, partial [Verrucomicrobiae bacterium]|nr:hypothetical protein [Verrucomicrobiae bacterium]